MNIYRRKRTLFLLLKSRVLRKNSFKTVLKREISCFHGLLLQLILHKQALEIDPSQVHIHALRLQAAAFLIPGSLGGHQRRGRMRSRL